MTTDDHRHDTPVLDEWRAEVGDEAIDAIVQASRHRIARGDGVGFSEKRRFLDHLREHRPRSA